MAYTIYKHIAPNGKVYIGVTSVKPEQRWGKDGIGYQGQAFYYAIQKYGWDNFEHEIIAENISAEYVECFEKALIAMYDSTNHNKGYNISQGGFGVENKKFYYLAVLDDYNLSFQDLFRFIYLSTYISKNNILIGENKKLIRKKQMPNILGFREDQVGYFLNNLIKNKYIKYEDNCFKMNKNIVSTDAPSDDRRYIKIYINSTRALYKKINVRKHKIVGYIYKMISYLNEYNNVLCLNPYEQCVDLINYIDFNDFSERIEINVGHAYRLRNEYKKLSFPVLNQEQYILFEEDKTITVNPNLMCGINVKIDDNVFILQDKKQIKEVELISDSCKYDE